MDARLLIETRFCKDLPGLCWNFGDFVILEEDGAGKKKPRVVAGLCGANWLRNRYRLGNLIATSMDVVRVRSIRQRVLQMSNECPPARN